MSPVDMWTESSQNIGANNLFTAEGYEVRLLWREDEVKLPKNFFSAMEQLKSLEQHLHKADKLQKRYQEIIETDVKAGYVSKVEQVEFNVNRDKLQFLLPNYPVFNPHKDKKIRIVCDTAADYRFVALKNKIFPGPDLLRTLIGMIFRFQEHQIALSDDIEAMFLHVDVQEMTVGAYKL